MKNILGKALLVWLGIIFVETIHGVLRAIVLVPIVGDLRARQLGVPIGSLLILIVSILTITWLGTGKNTQLLCIGVLWVVLTLVFEFVLGYFILGLAIDRLASDYDMSRGGYMLFGLVFLLFSPLIAAKLRRGLTK